MDVESQLASSVDSNSQIIEEETSDLEHLNQSLVIQG